MTKQLNNVVDLSKEAATTGIVGATGNRAFPVHKSNTTRASAACILTFPDAIGELGGTID